MIKEILPVFQLLLTAGNLIVLCYALAKFLMKPHNSLETRVIELEVKQREMAQQLLNGNDKFKKQDDTNEVFINCMLAFIDFELLYCSHTNYTDTDDLDKAKDTLRKHLAKARG